MGVYTLYDIKTDWFYKVTSNRIIQFKCIIFFIDIPLYNKYNVVKYLSTILIIISDIFFLNNFMIINELFYEQK